MKNNQRMRGVVRWFDNRKQYGWIRPDDGCGGNDGKDLFFGKRSLLYDSNIDPNTRVEFHIGTDREGRVMALAVRPCDGEA
jgi:cold shock CspA family protein